MSVLNLKKLFKPESVALIGASEKPGSLGNVVMKNLISGGFSGPILPVNPKYKFVNGVLAYQDIKSLPVVPDLAVICTPAITIPDLIKELGERGTRAAVVLSAGFHESIDGESLQQRMLDAAKPYDLRILGPNCVGLLIPSIGLNASFAHTNSLKGNLAFVSQSGALCTTILDWAKSKGIGFSYFISLGDNADIDFGDLLDYLGSDQSTHGVVLYMESVKLARKFMSAARATSRNLPVIVIKSGRVAEGAKAATSHTGALSGSDDVFDAAIRRAGMLRVYTINNIFDAVETLARARPIKGNRLTILTNGGGPGVLATDHLITSGGRIAELSPETIEELNTFLPPTWSKANPVDIIGDGDADRYLNALKVLIKDPNHDAILVMLVPVAVINNKEVAIAVANEINQTKKPILTCWMGEDGVAEAREIFEQEGIPSFDTPYSAIQAFMQIVEYGCNKESLMETPPSITEGFDQGQAKASTQKIIKSVLQDKRNVLTEPEAKNILAAYGIPIVETKIAYNVDDALNAADDLGYPVVLKILSSDITHKSDVGGVLVGIDSGQTLQLAAEGMLARIKKLLPAANIDGFTVQKMVARGDSYELIIGVATDPIFGPAILFGHGGVSVEVINDKAVALPPINIKLAEDLISRTRISKLLSGYRGIPAANLEEVKLTLVKISQLIIDNPEIIELDINPLFADSKGVVALDARIKIKATNLTGSERLVIRPYPKELEERIILNNGQEVVLRPIRPEDESAHHEFLSKTDPQDIYFRFFKAANNFSHQFLARFTQIDYDREMAFIAKTTDHKLETLGVIRAISDSDNNEAEIAIIIRSDIHKNGLGKKLMEKLISYCRKRGTKRLTGQLLPENHAMLRLVRKFHFETQLEPESNIIYFSLEL
ncbi:MAG: bifunctional acetate--CoA ligase family protein/GNAT family N-acetyltransferase [Proteobacteria bacterium]|nr:bifunctional acyl-CoA synthetase/GNAT family N-acetyltransferase [Pseudomonadota bacterium]NOG59149.1 bifunctional acetate--CoA ligase family protein/GNAT family N-acetyltransferase [Pseudomonadota bacterium]